MIKKTPDFGSGSYPTQTSKSWTDTCMICMLVVAWGIFGVLYNILSKKILQEVPMPMVIGLLQLFVCSTVVFVTWLLSPPPSVRWSNHTYGVIAGCHSIGMLATLYSIAHSSVGFTHIIKSGEPIATAAFSWALTPTRYSHATYSTLVIIVIGIALSSAKDLSFTWEG